jgi:hypothetical protein
MEERETCYTCFSLRNHMRQSINCRIETWFGSDELTICYVCIFNRVKPTSLEKQICTYFNKYEYIICYLIHSERSACKTHNAYFIYIPDAYCRRQMKFHKTQYWLALCVQPSYRISTFYNASTPTGYYYWNVFIFYTKKIQILFNA